MIKRIVKPPPPPPPPQYEEAILCDGCGQEACRSAPEMICTLPLGWFWGYISETGALRRRLDICPACLAGTTVTLPNGSSTVLAAHPSG